MIGHFLDEGVGDVGYRNAAGRCRRDINRVNPDGTERNDAAPLQPVDNALGDRHALGIERIGIARCGDEGVLGPGGNLDDFGIESLQGFHLELVAGTGHGETVRARGDDLELGHGHLPNHCYT